MTQAQLEVAWDGFDFRVAGKRRFSKEEIASAPTIGVKVGSASRQELL